MHGVAQVHYVAGNKTVLTRDRLFTCAVFVAPVCLTERGTGICKCGEQSVKITTAHTQSGKHSFTTLNIGTSPTMDHGEASVSLGNHCARDEYTLWAGSSTAQPIYIDPHRCTL